MIPPTAGPEFGTFNLQHDGDFIAGMKTTVLFEYEVGEKGLHAGGQIRVGVPNTGWEEPVPPQQRYWDELIQNGSRRLAPFHPVNTTAVINGREGTGVVLTVMERMLTPDEDPAIAYWRWWITATLEGGSLKAGDKITITYGDRRFGSDGVRVQTFVEDRINVVAFVKHEANASFHQLAGSPKYFDVVSGAPSRANVVAASTYTEKSVPVRVERHRRLPLPAPERSAHRPGGRRARPALQAGHGGRDPRAGVAPVESQCHRAMPEQFGDVYAALVGECEPVGAGGLGRAATVLGRPSRAERASRDALAEQGLSADGMVERDFVRHGG